MKFATEWELTFSSPQAYVIEEASKLEKPDYWGVRLEDIKNYIPIEDMIIGQYYTCKARNFRIGYWNGEGMVYLRHKFNRYFQDVEYHWDSGPPFGTVKPVRAIEEPTAEQKKEFKII